MSVCLEEAETSQLSSIAFPAIGTGALGHSLASAAQNMCESIVRFGQRDPTFINRVRVIVFQQSVVQDFIDQLTLSQVQANNDKLQTTRNVTTLKSPPRFIRRAINKVPSIFHKPKSPALLSPSATHASNPVAQPTTNKSVLVVQVFSDDIKKIQKAEKRLWQLMQDQLSTDVVDDKLIALLSRKEQADIKHKAKVRKIKITFEIGKFQHNIQLKGDKEDIAELKKEIAEVLTEKNIKDLRNKEMQSVNAKVQWKWCNNSGVYEDYDNNANYAIEQAYQANKAKKFVYKNQQSVTEDTVDDDATDFNMLSEEFDFQQMKAKDLNDSLVVYDIKRNDIDHSKLVYFLVMR